MAASRCCSDYCGSNNLDGDGAGVAAMSLVNDMLRDLEKRGQGGQSPLSDDSVRSVSHSGSARRPQKRSWPLLIVLVALILGFALLAWQLWQQRSQDSLPAQKHVASHTALAVQPSAPEVVVVNPQPEPALVTQRLVISQVRWLPTSAGGELVMQFNARPDIQLLNQTRQSVVIALPNARLDNTLPLPSSEVISEFNLMSAQDQLLLDLKASRDARFSLIRDSEHQIRVQVLLAKQQLSSPPTSVSKSIRPSRSEVVSGAASTEARIAETKRVKTSSSVSSTTGRPANVSVADNKTKKPQTAKPPTSAKPKAITPQTNAKVVAQSKPATKPVFQKTTQVLTDDQAVAKARKLLQKNKVSTAQALLQKQLEQAPASSESRALLAGIYLAAGEHDQSETLVDEGLAVLPLDSGLKKVKARVLLAKGDSAAAVNLMESAPPAIKLDGEYHEIRAAALQQQGRAEDAVNVYYQLLKYDSRQARLWVGLGYSLELATRMDESRKAYESSLQVPNLDDNLKRFVTQRLKQLAER
ncbi:MAG: tetratricopeptide repeat protein [Oceanospirillaceae bacterium]|nr:tetratricopeptide repeat protein [Oceanospirillaceae bacterium]